MPLQQQSPTNSHSAYSTNNNNGSNSTNNSSNSNANPSSSSSSSSQQPHQPHLHLKHLTQQELAIYNKLYPLKQTLLTLLKKTQQQHSNPNLSTNSAHSLPSAHSTTSTLNLSSPPTLVDFSSLDIPEKIEALAKEFQDLRSQEEYVRDTPNALDCLLDTMRALVLQCLTYTVEPLHLVLQHVLQLHTDLNQWYQHKCYTEDQLNISEQKLTTWQTTFMKDVSLLPTKTLALWCSLYFDYVLQPIHVQFSKLRKEWTAMVVDSKSFSIHQSFMSIYTSFHSMLATSTPSSSSNTSAPVTHTLTSQTNKDTDDHSEEPTPSTVVETEKENEWTQPLLNWYLQLIQTSPPFHVLKLKTMYEYLLDTLLKTAQKRDPLHPDLQPIYDQLQAMHHRLMELLSHPMEELRPQDIYPFELALARVPLDPTTHFFLPQEKKKTDPLRTNPLHTPLCPMPAGHRTTQNLLRRARRQLHPAPPSPSDRGAQVSS